jgi:peptide/nickel transport system permease protein
VTAPSAPPALPPTSTFETRVSYWQVVGAQLRKNRVAMAAWFLVKVLLGLAVFAPLLAFNVPWFHWDRGAEGPWLPLVSSLFDRSLFENGVDVFFNVVLLCGALWLPLSTALRRMVRRRAASRGPGATAIVFAVLAAGALGMELWAAATGRTALRAVVFGAVLPGALIVAVSLLRSTPHAPRTSGRARFACGGLIAAAVVAVFVLPIETSPYRVWQGPKATVAGWKLFPPVAYHPNAVGEPEAIDRARARPDLAHALGCDMNGRDVVARLLFGSRISVTIGLVAVSIYVFIGIVLGSLMGYFGGKVDLLLMRLVEIMICFPTMFLLLTVIALFGRSIFLIMAAIGLVGWPGVARLVRAEFLRQRGLDYVTAARAQGLKQGRIIFRHVLPNCLGPVLVSATFGIAGAILTESGLAFLGLGDPTSVSWGEMLTRGRASQEWHLILAPGFAIFFVVTVFNLLGEGLRDALDPKLRR